VGHVVRILDMGESNVEDGNATGVRSKGRKKRIWSERQNGYDADLIPELGQLNTTAGKRERNLMK
jgi:hypothetical protein